MEEAMALQEVLIENKTLKEMTLDSMESEEEVQYKKGLEAEPLI